MPEGQIECKDCRYWTHYPGQEVERNMGLADFGICKKINSPNWSTKMHRDNSCEFGELERRKNRTNS